MTVQKTNSISLEEITGIQLECRNCGVKTLIPIAAEGRFPVACGYCDDSWVVNSRTDLHQRFLNSISAFLSAMKQVADGSNNVNCLVSLEIKPEIETHGK